MRQLLKSKKGAEMTIGTIIIIILALLVLVFLIYAFFKSGGSLTDTLKNFFAGGPNVDTIKSACTAACTTQSTYAYCTESRTLKLDDTTSWKGSCFAFASNGKGGIGSCGEVSCTGANDGNVVDAKAPAVAAAKDCGGLGGSWIPLPATKACPTGKTDFTKQASDASSKTGQLCCQS
jgi:hypothetical protein